MAKNPTYEELGKRVKELEQETVKRKQAEDRIKGLNRLQEDLLVSGSLAEKMKRITDGVVQILSADFARIWLTKQGDICDSGCMNAEVSEGPHVCHDRNRCLHLTASSGRYTHMDGAHGRVPFGGYKIGRVAAAEEPGFLSNDVTHDPRVHNHEWAKELGLVSFAGYRLLSHEGAPIGVLALFSKQTLSAREETLLQTIAGTASEVILVSKSFDALQESEEKYRTVLESNPDPVVVYDLEGRVIYLNPAFTRIFGWSLEEQIGKKIDNFVPEKNWPETKMMINKVTVSGESFSGIETRRYTKKGEILDISISGSSYRDQGGNVTASVINLRDITDQKLVEETLRESEEKYRLLIETATDAIFIAQDEVLKFANPKAEEMTGYSAEELAEIPFVDLIYPADRSVVIERHVKRLKGEEIPNIYSFRILNKSGKELSVELNTIIISWEGRPATLNFLRDITAQKRLEAQLQQAQKMEAVGTLAGGIAHDFNNLLMAIQGRTSIVLMSKDSSHPDFDHLKGIEGHIKSAADLTRQLLGFARGGKYEVRPTDLNELIEKQNRMFGRTKKEIIIHGKYEEDLWSVEIDRGQIEQVLLNLYVNAWQAMPGGGDLYLSTENVTLDKSYVKPFSIEHGRYVKISVTDTGVGMDKTTQKKIFDPFFTTKEMGRGTGLGLASSYGIIKNHGGLIDVYSEKGHGTTFNIYLPASSKEIVEDTKPSGDTVRGTETVLFVDDEDIIIEVAEELFKELGYEILIARGGKEAVEIYEKNKDRIDIVVLDMIMPDMSGSLTYDRMNRILFTGFEKTRCVLEQLYQVG